MCHDRAWSLDRRGSPVYAMVQKVDHKMCAMTVVLVGRMGGHIDCFNGAIWLSLSATIPLHLGRVELIIVELTLICYDW